MRVETIERLHCPASHAPSPLITVAFERDGDWLIEGVLGCSLCGAEYIMAKGVVSFEAPPEAPIAAARDVESDTPAESMRLAALLALSEPGMRIVLYGALGQHAAALELATGAKCLVVNAHVQTDLAHGADHISMPVNATLPVAHGAIDGMAVDDAHIPQLARAAVIVRAGGRVLAPSAAPVPSGCTELARDAYQWVAEVDAPQGRLVTLTVRRPTG